ncbi:MAG: deoxyribonuclease V [Candidatus Subteraquimicrobiales bacterium]|nr:deoxyribonuclease V [Candidatus Subteraquimicrobiales bacterium]
MKIAQQHLFNLTPKEAAELQLQLRKKLIFDAGFDIDKVNLVAGADVSYSVKEDTIYATVVVLSFPDLKVVEEAWAKRKAGFPYIPGLLVFREGPALLDAFEKIENEPDVVFFDGHGVSHPRGFGIASHLGILLDKPSVGVAKTNLVGELTEPSQTKGSMTPIIKNGEIIGMTVRTKDKVKPVYVSVGHKISLKKAVELVLKVSVKFRIPEPTRQAHLFSNEIRISLS